MRLTLWTLIIATVISFGFIGFEKIYYNKNISSAPENTKQSDHENVQQKTTKFLIPVTEFTNISNITSFSELKNAKLATLTENLEYIPQELINLVEVNDTVDFKKAGVYLLLPQQVEPWYQTIIIDNNNFWSKNFDSNTYLLKKEINSTEDKYSEAKTIIFASGEIIPARAVDRLGLNKYDNYTYLFDFFRKDIESADIAIALLENSLLGNPAPCTGCMSFVGDDKVSQGLKETGLDVISTAGNHAGDAGQKAYENTLNLLEANNIAHTGTGNCIGDKCSLDKVYDVLKPVVKKVNGITFGIVAADDIAAYYWKRDNASNYFGTNTFSSDKDGLKPDLERIKQLPLLKEKYAITYLIVYMSWGIEYTNQASAHQQELGKLLIDNGVDLIIGSHPHWVQNIEFYKSKPIIYSMGNFIFDQTHTLPTRQGIVVNLYFMDNSLKSIELMPHQTCGYHQTKNDLTPQFLNKEINLDDLNITEEKNGCIYWQPHKLKPHEPAYTQILSRIYEHTKL